MVSFNESLCQTICKLPACAHMAITRANLPAVAKRVIEWVIKSKIFSRFGAAAVLLIGATVVAIARRRGIVGRTDKVRPLIAPRPSPTTLANRAANKEAVCNLLTDYRTLLKLHLGEKVDNHPEFIEFKVREFLQVYGSELNAKLSEDTDLFNEYLTGIYGVLCESENTTACVEDLDRICNELATPEAFRAKVMERLESDGIAPALFEEAGSLPDQSYEQLFSRLATITNARKLETLKLSLEEEFGDEYAAAILADWAIIGTDIRFNLGVLTEERIAYICGLAHEKFNPTVALEATLAEIRNAIDTGRAIPDEDYLERMFPDLANTVAGAHHGRSKLNDMINHSLIMREIKKRRADRPKNFESTLLSALGFETGASSAYRNREHLQQQMQVALEALSRSSLAAKDSDAIRKEIEELAQLERYKAAGVPHELCQKLMDATPMVAAGYREVRAALKTELSEELKVEFPGDSPIPPLMREMLSEDLVRHKRRQVLNLLKEKLDAASALILEVVGKDELTQEQVTDLLILSEEEMVGLRTKVTTPPEYIQGRIRFYEMNADRLVSEHECIQGFGEERDATLGIGRCFGESMLDIAEQMNHPTHGVDQLPLTYNVAAARRIQATYIAGNQIGSTESRKVDEAARALGFETQEMLVATPVAWTQEMLIANPAEWTDDDAPVSPDEQRTRIHGFVDALMAPDMLEKIDRSSGVLELAIGLPTAGHSCSLRIDREGDRVLFRDPNFGRLRFPLGDSSEFKEVLTSFCFDFYSGVKVIAVNQYLKSTE